MARYMRTDLGRGHTHLRPPVVVATAAVVVYFGPSVNLVPKPAVENRRRQRRSQSRLWPPVLVFVPEPQELSGPEISLNLSPRENQILRRSPFSRLSPPRVVTTAAAEVFAGPRVELTRQRRRLSTRSRLAPPAILATNGVIQTTFVRIRPRKTLTFLRRIEVRVAPVEIYGPETSLARIKPPILRSALAAPVVVNAAQDQFGEIRISLAPQRRGRPRSTFVFPYVVASPTEAFGFVAIQLVRRATPPTTTRLAPPAVASRPHARPVATKLVRISPPGTMSRLGGPVIVSIAAVEAYYGPQVTLTPSRRGVPQSLLRPPVVVFPELSRARLVTNLAYSRRGTAKSALFPPTDTIGLEDQGRILITLAPQRRGAPKSQLFPPADVVGLEDQGEIRVTLAPSLPTGSLSTLRSPVVVSPREGQVFFGPQTSLVRIKPAAVRSDLAAPIVVTAVRHPHGGVMVSLAPQRRGKVKSRLQPPVFVTAVQVAVYGPTVNLTYSRRGAPKSTLFPPTDTVGLEDQGQVRITLAPSRRGTPKSILFAPTDTIGLEDQGRVVTHLAPQARRPGVANLFPPAVIDTRTYFGPTVNLTYSVRKPGRAELVPPAVVQAAEVVFYGPLVTLTPSSRGKPKSQLLPPEVVGAGRVNPGIRRYLVARKTRLERLFRKNIYELRPPVVIEVPFFTGPETTLAPQRRGAPTFFLRPPVIPPLARPVALNLTYSRRGRPVYFLQPPTIVRVAVEIFGPEITLTPSKRGQPFSVLRPPAVRGIAPHRGILTSLTRIVPAPTVARVIPPTVIGEPQRYFGPETTLVRIKPPATRYFRIDAVVISFEFVPDEGDVCGFDISNTFICFVEESGSQVIGGDQTNANIEGTTASSSKITGGERSSGSVIGGDQEAN